ncbi:MAG: winged helix-turn-helix domain-containing protein [bacterium]|nr:winged helix-turn-helix domain-containing protein [bacterium]
MESQSEAIINTLFRIARKYQKAYCYPSQKRILGLLRKYRKLQISLRTLNRRLAELEEEGYFTRVRRHRAGPGGCMVFNSTLYKLGGRAFNWLYGQGKQAQAFFSFYRLPKMAIYKGSTAGDLSFRGKVSCFVDSILKKGTPSAVFRTA